MQQLYLDDQVSASANVASDVATPTPDVQIETDKETSPQTLNAQKGETTVEPEQTQNTVPTTPSEDGIDMDLLNTKIAEGVLNSLVDSVPSSNVVPDAPTSLVQGQSLTDLVGNVEDITDHVIADKDVHQEKDDNAAGHTDKVVPVEEDLEVLKTVAGKKSEGSGIGRRLKERKGKETEAAAEATKSDKKKSVGPTRRSSRVEIPVQQKK
jgi:hypothetical protein